MFLVVEPYAPIKAVPLRSVFEAIIERAKKEGLSIEIENDRITFISGATWVLTNEKRPDIEGYYDTINSNGQKQYTPFKGGHWLIEDGMLPVVKWKLKQPPAKL